MKTKPESLSRFERSRIAGELIQSDRRTHAEIAEAMGISTSAIHSWSQGWRVPKPIVLAQLRRIHRPKPEAA